jgi:hypothetical protein
VVREPILLRSGLHDREIEVALKMARIEPLSTQPGPLADISPSPANPRDVARDRRRDHLLAVCVDLPPVGKRTRWRSC